MRVKWVSRRLGFVAVLIFCVVWTTVRIWTGQSTFSKVIGWSEISEIEKRNSHTELGLFYGSYSDQVTVPQQSRHQHRTKWLFSTTPDGVCGQKLDVLNSWEVIVLKQPTIKDTVRQDSHCKFVSQLGGANAQVTAWHALAPFLRASIYAIQNGAEQILIIRNKSYLSVIDLVDPEDGTESSYLLCKTPMTLFDPFVHFLGLSTRQACDYKLCKSTASRFVAPAQFYIGGENNTSSDYDFTAPQVTLNEGTFASFSRELLLFPRNAFWSLPLALVNPDDEAQRKVWSLAVQYLIWLCDVRVTLFSPLKVNGSLPHPVSLPNNTDRTLQFLDAWNCDRDSFYECLFSLLENMIQHKLIGTKIKVEMTTWIDILNRIGYAEPEMKQKPEINKACGADYVQYNPVPRPISHPNSVPILPDKYSKKIRKVVYRSCISIYKIWRMIQNPEFQFRDVLLVIVFNNPHYTAIPYLEVLYRSFFPFILYCGPTELDPIIKPFFSDFSYISYGETVNNHSHGAFNYRCLELAVHMRYSVSGYLVIADDLILNPWNVFDNARDQIWYPSDVKIADIRSGLECRYGDCSLQTRWRWWSDYKSQVMQALEELNKMSVISGTFKNYSTRLIANNGGSYHVNGGYADIYYIPRKYAKQFADLAPLFYRNEVFLEIAVPTIINAISSLEKAKKIEGYLDWFEESRHEPWKKFNSIQHKAYFHPWKLGGLNPDNLKAEAITSLRNYCQYLVQFIHNHARLPTPI